MRYVPVVGKSVGGIVDATGHVVTGTLGVAGGVVGGVLGGVGAAGRGLARGELKGAAKGAFREVKGGINAAGAAASQAGKDASSSLGRGLRDTMDDGVKAAKFVGGAASNKEGQKRALGITAPREEPVGDLDDTAGGDEPLPAAITPEAGPGTVAKGAGPSSQKKSGARSIRKAVAKATGMHGTFSGKPSPKADPVPRRLFPDDDGPPLRVPPEVAAPAPPVEEIDDW